MAPKKLTPFSIDDILAWEPNKGRKIYLEQKICLEKRIVNKHFTKIQKDKLSESFKAKKYLTKYEREQLAREVGTTEDRVRIWYQNRRKKWRKDEGVPDELWCKLRREANERVHYQPKSVYMLGTAYTRHVTQGGAAFERIVTNKDESTHQSTK